MFDSFFPVRFINTCLRRINDGEDHLLEYNYSFRGKNNKRYLVIIEEYNYECFAIKFCLQEHKNFHDRFSRLSHQYECPRVITTIITIIMEILSKKPFASFVFVGSPEQNQNSYHNTRRFALYEKILNQIVGAIHFERTYNYKNSTCIFLNINNTNKDLQALIEQMFRNYYPDLFKYEG